MEITWIYFISALVLLFYPLNDFLRGQVRLRDYEEIRQQEYDSPWVWWRQSWVWWDPLRACAGGWLLRSAWSVDPLIQGAWKHTPFAGMMIVLFLAIIVQMHTHRDDEVFLAPLGYCVGIVFAFLPPQIAILVVVAAAACLMAFRSWSAFFLFGALWAGVFGYMILKVQVEVVAGVALMGVPLLVSLLTQRELRLPVVRVR